MDGVAEQVRLQATGLPGRLINLTWLAAAILRRFSRPL
jgi:hypothetical protein